MCPQDTDAPLLYLCHFFINFQTRANVNAALKVGAYQDNNYMIFDKIFI